MDSAWDIWTSPDGFPHSGIHGSLPAFGFPWLFVDRYALLRLLVPRHPPCALSSLTFGHLSITCVSQSCSNHFFGFSVSFRKLLNRKDTFSLGYHKCFRIHASLLLRFRFIQFSRYRANPERIRTQVVHSFAALNLSPLIGAGELKMA